MDRLQEVIKNKSFEMDALIAYNQIIESGSCNDCSKKKKCEYEPKLGELVRYNCPFYEKVRANK